MHHGHEHTGRHERKRFSESFLFSPNELSVVGYSGTGKTTLIAALLRKLAGSRKIAYIKHAAHGFTIDPECKDTWRASESGASSVYVENGERFALLGHEGLDEWNGYDLWNDSDVVLVEGYRSSRIPKLVVVDREGAILNEVAKGEIENVVAYVLRDDMTSRKRRSVREAAGNLPLFEARNTDGIAAFVTEFFVARARSTPFYGLVLGGGKSTRMKQDKAAIDYRGEPQVRYAYTLLQRFCERVFVSNRSDQAENQLFDGLQQIHDRFIDMGPMGGILSAFHAYPEAAWLVLGCDLPFVDDRTLSNLIAERDPLLLATCYDSAHDGLPEPLCAIYEPRYRRRLHQFLADGRDCPRKALINSRTRRIKLADPKALDNINNPEEYRDAVQRIREEAVSGS